VNVCCDPAAPKVIISAGLQLCLLSAKGVVVCSGEALASLLVKGPFLNARGP